MLTVNKSDYYTFILLYLHYVYAFLQDAITHTIPWRVQNYEDLTVVEGERINFTWQGFHSLHQVISISFMCMALIVNSGDVLHNR